MDTGDHAREFRRRHLMPGRSVSSINPRPWRTALVQNYVLSLPHNRQHTPPRLFINIDLSEPFSPIRLPPKD